VLQAWKDLGLVVLQQVGAQQLALGTGETGSRSVGEVHDARAQAYVRGVTAVLESELQRVVKQLVDVNWGPQEAYPKLKLTLKRPELGVQERIAAMKVAKDGGLLTVLARDESAVREALGLSPIDDDERDAAKTQARPTDGAGQEDGDSPGQLGPSNLRNLKASAQRTAWQPWRQLRASEKMMPLAEMDAFITAQREAFERAVKSEVLAMLAMAAPDIKAAMADGSPDEVATLPFASARLDAAIRKFLAGVRAKGNEFARAELAHSQKLQAAEEGEEEDDKTPAEQEVRDGADEVVEAQAKALSRRMQARLRGELEREAIDVLRTGGDAQEVVTRTVTRQLESGAFKADAGTVTAKVLNVGRDEAARIMGGVAQVELTAILDSATCGVCRELDGKRADFNSAEHDAMLPPVRDCSGGDNCRCLLTFIPEGDE